jgi:hypothetical protein
MHPCYEGQQCTGQYRQVNPGWKRAFNVSKRLTFGDRDSLPRHFPLKFMGPEFDGDFVGHVYTQPDLLF